MATPNMNLELPVVSVTAGPLYATENNEAFEAIDEHDHTSGKGVPVPVSGLNINADLSLEGYNLTVFRSLRCQTQAAALATGSDVECYYSVAGVPYYNNAAGAARQLVAVSAPYVTGDIFYASSTTAVSRLGIGTTGQVLKSTGTVPAWQGSGSSSSITSKSANYTLTSSDDDIICNASGGAFTLTLPDASSNSGKVYKIYRKDGTFANALTVLRAGADTISFNNTTATSFLLYTVDEYIEIQSDGISTWYVLDHRTNTPWIAYTPTGNHSTNVTYTGFWRRTGDSIEVQAYLAYTGATDAAVLSVNYPTGMTMNTSKVVGSGAQRMALGYAISHEAGGSSFPGIASRNSDTSVLAWWDASPNAWSNTVPYTIANGDIVSFRFIVPISGWNG